MNQEIKTALAELIETEENQAFKFRDLQKRRVNWAVRVNSEEVQANDGYAYMCNTLPKLLKLEQEVLKEFEYAHVYTIMVYTNVKDKVDPMKSIHRAKKALERAEKTLNQYEHDMSLNEEVMGIMNFSQLSSEENK